LKNWQNNKVLVIGAARQGLAVARYLARKNASVVLNDVRSVEDFGNELDELTALQIEMKFGGHPLQLLNGIDLVCISGGVPLTLPVIKKAVKSGIPLTNDSQIFMEATDAKTIGITGSAGKTTTTILIGAIAKADAKAGETTWVGGNIGDPLINYVDKIQADDWVVMEISSFQLEQMDISPNIALVLNITPNHLDRHGNMAAYTAVKSRIITYQKSDDIAVLNLDDAGSSGLFDLVPGKIITFSNDRPTEYQGVYSDRDDIVFTNGINDTVLMNRKYLRLPGDHNFLNALAACAVAIAAGFSPEAMREGIWSVEGIPHRLELVRKVGGVCWVNDSIATAPERVIAAIQALKQPLVLLLGGRDKDLPWQSLAELMHVEKPKTVLFGEAASLIETALREYENGDPAYPLHITESFEEAFRKAASIAEPGETVLLSPGGTSFDAYRDFEERGEHFRKMVEELE